MQRSLESVHLSSGTSENYSSNRRGSSESLLLSSIMSENCSSNRRGSSQSLHLSSGALQNCPPNRRGSSESLHLSSGELLGELLNCSSNRRGSSGSLHLSSSGSSNRRGSSESFQISLRDLVSLNDESMADSDPRHRSYSGIETRRRSSDRAQAQGSLTRRLRELEREKSMVEQALRRSFTDELAELMHQASEADQDSTADNGSAVLSAAGCHLEMMAAASGRRHSSNSGAGMMQQTGGGGPKLVWKRGPNGAWGRFPENDSEENNGDIQNPEDALVARALKRSLFDR